MPTFAANQTINNLITFVIMTTKTNRAQSAKKETTKRVNNRRAAAQVETIAAAVIEDVKAETIETKTEEDAAAFLPVAPETESETEKVTSKEVLKAAGSLRAAVKEERRGANCTIRLIAQRAAAGDVAAVNIICHRRHWTCRVRSN